MSQRTASTRSGCSTAPPPVPRGLPSDVLPTATYQVRGAAIRDDAGSTISSWRRLGRVEPLVYARLGSSFSSRSSIRNGFRWSARPGLTPGHDGHSPAGAACVLERSGVKQRRVP